MLKSLSAFCPKPSPTPHVDKHRPEAWWQMVAGRAHGCCFLLHPWLSVLITSSVTELGTFGKSGRVDSLNPERANVKTKKEGSLQSWKPGVACENRTLQIMSDESSNRRSSDLLPP